MEGLVPLLPLVGILAVFWLLIIRPGVRRERERKAMQAQLAVGDGIVLTSGFFGTITALHDDRAEVELAPGTVVTVALGAVAGPDPALAHLEDDEHDDRHEDLHDDRHDDWHEDRAPGAPTLDKTTEES